MLLLLRTLSTANQDVFWPLIYLFIYLKNNILTSLNSFVPLTASMYSITYLSTSFMDHDIPLEINVLSHLCCL